MWTWEHKMRLQVLLHCGGLQLSYISHIHFHFNTMPSSDYTSNPLFLLFLFRLTLPSQSLFLIISSYFLPHNLPTSPSSTRMRRLVLTGIGDRHAQNILIDTVTAELVHIDFGIVFEQGKTLTTPETVPFRLTRYDMMIRRFLYTTAAQIIVGIK